MSGELLAQQMGSEESEVEPQLHRRPSRRKPPSLAQRLLLLFAVLQSHRTAFHQHSRPPPRAMSSSPPTSPSPSLASPTSTSSSPTPPDSPSSRAQEHSDQAPEACHFDRLSNELIVALLSYLEPTASIALYLDPPQVYNALFAVRLVSKRLCAVTRDILWRRAIIMTTSRTDIARAAGVLAALPGRALDCRELHISNMFGDPYFDVEGWAATLPSIQRITLSYTSSHLDRFAHFHRASPSPLPRPTPRDEAS